ncbi:MAG: site-2 protease family protein [Chloroflexota bacterium]
MGRSFKLFSVRGIDIRLHATFPLILIWAAFQFGILANGGWLGALFGTIVVSLLFVLVTLHELGHSFAALYFGVPVEKIVLLPIGGVAQLKEMPDKPYQEFVIAIAGPLVNVAVAIVLLLFSPLLGFSALNPLAVLNGPISISIATISGYLFFYNIALAIFNMIPAFPMDGGRVLRSLLAMWLDYGRSTQIATGIGRALALGLGIYGFINGSISLMFIAFFVYSGATQENRIISAREKVKNFNVGQAYIRQPLVLSPYDNLQRAINYQAMGIQREFPVVYAGQLMGFLKESDLIQALTQQPTWTLVKDVMSRNIEPVSPLSRLDDVQARMHVEQVSALPVVDGNQFLGLITNHRISELFGSLRITNEKIIIQSA